MYRSAIYRIIHDERGWCVCKKTDSDSYWHRISNFYMYRGWAQAFARRLKIPVQNYESYYV